MRALHVFGLLLILGASHAACSSSSGDGASGPIVETGGYMDSEGIGGQAGSVGVGGYQSEGEGGDTSANAGTSSSAGSTSVSYSVITTSVDPVAANPAATKWLSPDLALARDPPPMPVSDPNGGPAGKYHLFVHLAKTGAATGVSSEYLAQAVVEGYYVIDLSYDNTDDLVALCGTDPVCFTSARTEILTGADVSSVVTVGPADSVEGRLTSALLYLQSQEPGSPWASFLVPGTPDGAGGSGGAAGAAGMAGVAGVAGAGGVNGGAAGSAGSAGSAGAASSVIPLWAQITLSGHVSGAGEAAFLATQHAVEHVVMVSGPLDPATSWIATPGQTPAHRFYAFAHTMDPAYAQITAIWGALGLDVTPGTITLTEGGTEPDPSTGIIDVDTNTPPYFYQRALSTSIAPRTGNPADAPDSPIDDASTPIDPSSSVPLYAPAWKSISSFD
jgi:hypothetical protein